MAFEIVWTKRAIKGYDKIIDYLEEHWTERELISFVTDTYNFFQTLSNYPEILQKTNRNKNLYRGPLNRLTILTYRIDSKKNQIIVVNIRGARQKPLKD